MCEGRQEAGGQIGKDERNKAKKKWRKEVSEICTVFQFPIDRGSQKYETK
jgi:hypothetical protein